MKGVGVVAFHSILALSNCLKKFSYLGIGFGWVLACLPLTNLGGVRFSLLKLLSRPWFFICCTNCEYWKGFSDFDGLALNKGWRSLEIVSVEIVWSKSICAALTMDMFFFIFWASRIASPDMWLRVLSILTFWPLSITSARRGLRPTCPVRDGLTKLRYSPGETTL